MITKQIYALLTLEVYAAKRLDNKPLLPPNWMEVLPQPTGTTGFAYSVYRNTATNEIVISFRGTDSGLTADWATNLGLSLSQETQAAAVYARVLKDYGAAANITFTGHSLGGGLAGTMAVWFNRTAVVFDPAPAQITATYGPSVTRPDGMAVTVWSDVGQPTVRDSDAMQFIAVCARPIIAGGRFSAQPRARNDASWKASA